ncbi:hypothetical protein KEU06_05535 [Pseudaminobacter sp. 19-2017]|uniref:Uncharacterized protein n=1 Tax=Pseudaminobacter soli (ex Zhang et al. 2022) TaxID=2831468 RepID=A0A942E007_9HYPH|nr:hypothetical protein [Pseudaminobacter soli]MBS3648090.1 hypothetical protein [Pseudaminobacter soli]
MVRQVAKLLDIVPGIIFGLGALYALSIGALGAHPADPEAWRRFMTLLPVMRAPFNFLASLPGATYGSVFIIFATAAACAPLLAALGRAVPRLRFAYAHAALMAVLFSMGSAGVFQAGHPGPFRAAWLLDWSPDLDLFPAYGYVLFALTALSCLAWHISMVSGLLRR